MISRANLRVCLHLFWRGVCAADGVGAVPEGSGQLHSAEGAGLEREGPPPAAVHRRLALPPVPQRTHHPPGEVPSYHSARRNWVRVGVGVWVKAIGVTPRDSVSLPLNHGDRRGLSETAGFFCKCQVRNMRVMTVMILITALVGVWNVFIWCKLNQPARTSNQNEWFFIQKPL